MKTATAIVSALLLLASQPVEAEPVAADGYKVSLLVPGSAFHTLNGITTTPDGRVFLASVSSDSIFSFDLKSGAVSTVVGPPLGHSDDVVVARDGTLYWTAIVDGIIRKRAPDGTISDVAKDIPGANSLALSRDETHLYVGQVFLGDGLWDVDLTGGAAPRHVLHDIGGLNAFTVDADGMIYGPLWERGEVVRIDPRTSQMKTLAKGLDRPGSVRIDGKGRLFALENGTAKVWNIDRGNGRKRMIAQLPSAPDNMTVAPSGHLLVSNMADNAVWDVDPESGRSVALISGQLAFPRAIAVVQGADGPLLYVTDTCSIRIVDARTGRVRDLVRRIVADLRLPSSINLADGQVITSSELLGAVQIIGQESGAVEKTITGFDKPSDVLKLANGDLLLAEPSRNRLILYKNGQQLPLAAKVDAPVSLAQGRDGSILVAEAKGRILRIALDTGLETEIAHGLGQLCDVIVSPDGTILALDVADRRLLELTPDGKAVRTIARDLPVGYLAEPYPRSGGIAVSEDGAIFIAADVENAIYRVDRQAAPSAQ
ncbi:hypothetical protein C1T17_08645 [Sphingobium sp. SCG-1]|uniref:SMP-30/gluconolactonase/LRE family protein n=1 Tax=Sphingobium sp. SCG-1 TaxID=2072936 RepID=UPI000CD67C70|nr:SMP-30/gluconolactonase/LRE family protein [Sphingobium sp. SCG-1]AUW58163.1 hypothetical protein C1T17_08645 [Sphingobium sp. SCG-1]